MPTLLDVRMRIPAGSPVVWTGWDHGPVRTGTAVAIMPGPVASSVWALDTDGSWLCLRWFGKRRQWLDCTWEHKAVLDQRAAIVNAMVDTELRLRSRRYAFVPPEDHYRTRPDENDHQWGVRSRNVELEHDLRVLAELRARFWAELYPMERGVR
jgi:hypothetical protein